MFNHESLLDDYIVFQKEPIHIMYIDMYGCYIIKNLNTLQILNDHNITITQC